jgi:hypothetical protein
MIKENILKFNTQSEHQAGDIQLGTRDWRG